MSDFEDAKLILTPNAYKAGKAYCVKPIDGSGDLTVVRNTSATRVNENGLIESVGANVPRLNYPIGGGCPSWLIEPQRTNLVTYSEDFSDASWVKEISGGAVAPVISINSDISPRGDLTADQIDLSIIGVGTVWVRQFYSETPGTTYTFSVWLKGDGVNKIGLGGSNLLKSTITPTIEWVKYSITWIGTSTSTKRAGLLFINSIDSTTSIFAWGAQLEQGNLTSYISTTGTTVTRNADVLTVAPPSGTTEIVETLKDITYYIGGNNLVTNSEDFSGSSWISNEVIVTPNFGISPRGDLTSNKLLFNSGLTRLSQSFSLLPSTVYTLSFYVKNISITNVSSTITGTIGFSTVPYDSSLIVGQWVRIQREFTTDAIGSVVIQITRNGNLGGEAEFWGAQLEQGNLTDYQATRNIVTVPTTYQLPNGEIKKVIMK